MARSIDGPVYHTNRGAQLFKRSQSNFDTMYRTRIGVLSDHFEYSRGEFLPEVADRCNQTPLCKRNEGTLRLAKLCGRIHQVRSGQSRLLFRGQGGYKFGGCDSNFPTLTHANERRCSRSSNPTRCSHHERRKATCLQTVRFRLLYPTARRICRQGRPMTIAARTRRTRPTQAAPSAITPTVFPFRYRLNSRSMRPPASQVFLRRAAVVAEGLDSKRFMSMHKPDTAQLNLVG